MYGTERGMRNLFVSISRQRLDEEAYKWSSARFYRKLWRPYNYVDWPDNPYNDDKWFGKDLTARIYLKFGNELEKTDVELEIEAELDAVGYEIVDYDRNKCRKKGDKPDNTPKLTGILAKIDKTGKLVNKFNRDAESRKGRIVNPDVEGKMVVISRHCYDVAGMTTGRPWEGESCMWHRDPANQEGGCYHPAVISDILRGTLVAYFTSEDDVDIKNPLSRLLIKPYYTKSGKVYLRQSDRSYPNPYQEAFPPQARQALRDWLRRQQGDLTEFAYFKDATNAHNSGNDPISSNMDNHQMMAIINKKAAAGLYKDRGDKLSLPPDVPSDEVLKHLDRYQEGATMVAAWIDNQKLEVDSPYALIPDALGNLGIFEFIRTRKRIKPLSVLRFVYKETSVLGEALKVAWETDIPRYLAVIQKNPDLLSLPSGTTRGYQQVNVTSYLIYNHTDEFKKILDKGVLEYLSKKEPDVFSNLVIQGIVPPEDPRWYLQKNSKNGLINAYSIYMARGYAPSVLEDIPMNILSSRKLLESLTERGRPFVDSILSVFPLNDPRDLPKVKSLVESILSSSRFMRGASSGRVRIFWILESDSMREAYLPRLLDQYGQDAAMLRLRDTGQSGDGRTLAHHFAEVEPRWIPEDASVLSLKYLDSSKGKNISVRDVIVMRGGKIGRYMQKRGTEKPEHAPEGGDLNAG